MMVSEISQRGLAFYCCADHFGLSFSDLNRDVRALPSKPACVLDYLCIHIEIVWQK